MTEYAIPAHLITPMDCYACEQRYLRQPVSPYPVQFIAQFPSMIKAAEKKGLCHMLVNDHMLEWVHENE